MATVQQRLSTIKHVILVLSGKGGVGKSSVAVQLSLSLVESGKKVGLLDIDLCGPSIPTMLGLKNQNVNKSSAGWVPVFADDQQRLSVMSIGFLLPNEDAPVIWRGPKKTGMIQQFISNVFWGELDYLIIDTPPGTSDEHISIAELLTDFNPDGVVLVTTPQGVALSDVRKELNFCKTAYLPILGVIENMSGFVCPHCDECYNLFSKGGGEAMAQEYGVPFLGRVPIDPQLTLSFEAGKNFIKEFPNSQTCRLFRSITDGLISQVEKMNVDE